MKEPTEKPKRGAPPHHFVGDAWLALRTEDVIEPELPIVDPHQHLWDRRPHSLYLLPELLQDIKDSGHQVRGTVYRASQAAESSIAITRTAPRLPIAPATTRMSM